MAPTVQLSESTFARLQKRAVPLVDDIESVINKLIDECESKASAAGGDGVVRQYSLRTPPNLTHTKILEAKLFGEVVKPEWNALLQATIIRAAAQLKNVKALRELIVVNNVEGKKEDQGYKYLPAAGISVQGQDSVAAWKATAHIVLALKFTIDVLFMWHDNEKAISPGSTGRFTFGE